MKAHDINSICAEGTEILAKLLDMEVEPEEAIGPAKKKAVAADLCTRREEGKGRERGRGREDGMEIGQRRVGSLHRQRPVQGSRSSPEVRGSSEGYPVYYFEFATKEKKLDETFK